MEEELLSASGASKCPATANSGERRRVLIAAKRATNTANITGMVRQSTPLLIKATSRPISISLVMWRILTHTLQVEFLTNCALLATVRTKVVHQTFDLVGHHNAFALLGLRR